MSNPYSSFTKPRSRMNARRAEIQRRDTAKRRQHRQRLREARAERPPTYRQLDKQLHSLDAVVVKMRDGHVCQQGLMDGVICEGIVDAGHLFPRSVLPYFKHDLRNIYAQCRYHNELHIGQPAFMATWFQRRFGEEAFEALHAEAVAATRPTRDDLLRMIAEREEQIAEFQLMMVA